jgi:TPP-dependent indolepyruvate ferredoxin oxidoreductase alpha subunit
MISTIREAYGYLSNQQTARRSEERGSRNEDRGERIEDRGESIEHRGSRVEETGSSPHSADGSSNVEHRTLNVEQVLSLGPAVIIARRECVLNAKLKPEDICDVSDIEKNCIGCKQCIIEFECPAIVFDEEAKRVKIDDGLCVQCGMCLYACPKQEKGKKLQKQYGKHTTKKRPK